MTIKTYTQLKETYAYMVENDVEIFCPTYSECGRFTIKNPAEYWENYGEYQAQLKQGKKEISLEDFELIAMDLF